ncbi:unnamed protein product [Discosporangium mesarthrocarpum]
MSSGTCQALGCENPDHQLDRGKVANYCATNHAMEPRRSYNIKICLEPGCTKRSHYGVPREVDPRSNPKYCSGHKQPGVTPGVMLSCAWWTRMATEPGDVNCTKLRWGRGGGGGGEHAQLHSTSTSAESATENKGVNNPEKEAPSMPGSLITAVVRTVVLVGGRALTSPSLLQGRGCRKHKSSDPDKVLMCNSQRLSSQRLIQSRKIQDASSDAKLEDGDNESCQQQRSRQQ